MEQQGRQKNVTGQGKPIEKRGEGLGSGPVGRQEGYHGRGNPSPSSGGSQGGGGPVRSSGGRKGGIIAIILALLLGGGGFGLSGLLGGGNETPTNNISTPTASIFSAFTNSAVSSDWVTTANTGKLDKTVAEGARAKRTVIYGDSRDKATVMVYMCGTDLETKGGMASNDMQEMAAATLGSNVDVIIYTGGCTSWKISQISNSVNQIWKIANGKMQCLVQNDGRDPMTKAATLTKFINYCTKNYPANRNMLIMWDHGGGSISGFGYDERNKTAGSLTLKGINDALKASGTKFDFIGFDACLMGTLENALMLDNYADYLIGSEETEPGVGWYYTNWLTALSKNPSMETLEIGKIIVDDFVSFCNQKCPGQKTTLSVVDLAELTVTVPSEFSKFATETVSTLKSNDYKVISDARANTREFAVSSKTDQIDLVHLAYNIGTDDAKGLADAILGAVKYNKTSSSISNAYGLAIYFPYKKTSRVESAVQAYESLDIDSNYTECIKSFASLELAGQVVAQDTQASSPLPSLLGQFAGQSPASSIDITSLLGSFLGGGATSSSSSLGGLGDLAGLAGSFLGRNLDVDLAAATISGNQLDTSNFAWTKVDGNYQMTLSESQWKQSQSLELNLFYDDGEGYIDMGFDNVYKITDEGVLISDFGGTWLAIDDQPVPYYHIDTYKDTTTGRVPVLLNGDRANLIIVFDKEHPEGYIAGARMDYRDGETETVAKGMEALKKGDKIEFVCDYYTYDGEYQDSYRMGDTLIYNGEHKISDVYVPNPEKCSATYLMTDSYDNEYWTPVIPND